MTLYMKLLLSLIAALSVTWTAVGYFPHGVIVGSIATLLVAAACSLALRRTFVGPMRRECYHQI